MLSKTLQRRLMEKSPVQVGEGTTAFGACAHAD